MSVSAISDSRRWRLMALVGVGYVTGSLTAFALFNAPELGAVLFPSAGVTAAALILTERRDWPFVLGTVAVCEFTIDVVQGYPPGQALGFVLANVAEPLIGVLLLRRFHSGPVDLTRRRDSAVFLATMVVAGPAVGGAIGAFTNWFSGSSSWASTFFPFWAGDALGVLTVGGTILAWTSAPPSFTRRSWREVLMVLCGVVLLTTVGFLPTTVPLAYLPVPLLFFCAFRYGIRVVLAGGLMMTLVANWLTAQGYGPWHQLVDTPRYEAATLQLYLSIVILGAWALAVEVAERERQQSYALAESRVNRRLVTLQELTGRLSAAVTTADVAVTVVDFADTNLCDVAQLTSSADTGQVVWRRQENGMVIGMPESDHHDDRSTLPPLEHVVTRTLSDQSTVMGRVLLGWRHRDSMDSETPNQIEAMVQLATQSLVRARLLERERDTVYRLQQALLPVVPETLINVDICAVYHPADPENFVGGDWYDVFLLGDGRVAFAVGDVMGHDLRAAAAMGQLRTMLRLVAQTADDPAHVLRQMDHLVGEIRGADLATLGYGDYDPVSNIVRFASAGHLPPLIRRPQEGASFLQGGLGPPLGLLGTDRVLSSLDVPAKTVLLWYTDGLVERRGEDITHGLARLIDQVDRQESDNPRLWCQALVRGQLAGRSVEDDAIVLALRFS